MRLLGTSVVTTDNKITLIERAAERMGIKKGDLIAFYDDNSNIIIEKV